MERSLINLLLPASLLLTTVSSRCQTLADVAPVSTTADELTTPVLKPEIPPLPTSPLQVRIQVNRSLTLKEAIDIALKRSVPLLLSRLTIERDEAEIRNAAAGGLPAVTINGSYYYTQPASIRGATPPVPAGGFLPTVNSIASLLTAQASVSWNFYSGGLIPGAVRAAEQTVRADQFDYERSRQDEILQVINAYYDLQNADGNVRIGQIALQAAQQFIADAKSLEQAGVGPRTGVLQAQAEYARRAVQLQKYLSDQTVKQRALAQALNFEQPTEVATADALVPEAAWQLSLEQSILRAFSQRQELQQQVALEQAARAREEKAYGLISPKLGIFAAAQTLNNFEQSTGFGSGYSGGLQVQWAAFDGGAASAQAHQAVVDAKSARARYLDQMRSIRFAVESAYVQMETASQRIEAADKGISAATDALASVQRRFKAGLAGATDVVVASRDLTDAQLDRLSATVDYNRSIAALKRATATL